MTPVPVATFEPAAPGISDDDFANVADVLLELAPIHREPDVLEYVESRGIASRAATWGALPATEKDQQRLSKALIDRVGADVWAASGLARRIETHRSDDEGWIALVSVDSSKWVWSRHRLLIPWRARGVQGRVTNIQRRALRPGAGPKYAGASGRKFPEPFGIEDAMEELGTGVALAFAEGAIDCVSYRVLAEQGRKQRGFAKHRPEIRPTFFDSPSTLADDVQLVAVVGLPGVNGWRPEWAELARGRTAILAFDADKAGEDAVARISGDLWAACATDVLRDSPVGHDWNDQLVGVAS